MSITDSTLLNLLGASYAALADALDEITEARWGESSLCEGWTVATVIAHLTMASRYDEASFTAELAADGFDFQTMSDRVALRDGELPPTTLLEGLRSQTMATFPMPGGGLTGSLSHVVIHGLDATWGLGLGRTCPDEAALVVLDVLVASSPTMFDVDIDDLALRATDLDWSHGEGQPVDRTAAELILTLSGRRIR